MAVPPDPPHGSDEARRILDRAGRDASGVFGGTLRRTARHFAATDADPTDKVELWGRRVGRALSLVGVLVLAWLLFDRITAR